MERKVVRLSPKSVLQRFFSFRLKVRPPSGRRQSRSSIKDFSHQSVTLQRPPQLLMPGCGGNFINLLNDWMISHWVHKPTLTSPVNFCSGPIADASIKESNFERFFSGFGLVTYRRKRGGKSFNVWFQFKSTSEEEIQQLSWKLQVIEHTTAFNRWFRGWFKFLEL